MNRSIIPVDNVKLSILNLSIKGLVGTSMLVWSAQVFALVPEPEGYRLENYDAPVPETLQGATRVNAVLVRKLQLELQAIVIDVIPEHRKPDNLPENQVWIPLPHEGVSNAAWLPDVGYGALSPVTLQYFRSNLNSLVEGDPSRPVVFYCRIDCWMSWNAAKRAVSWGYSQVYWFADGIDDWRFEGYPVEILKPAEGKRH